MFSIDDVRIPIRIMLEPGIYTCGNISANGKTKLLNLCKEYGIAGFPVYGYTYNDFLNHVPFSVQEDIWLVFIDRYDLPNLPKLLYIGFKLIPQIPYKIGV